MGLQAQSRAGKVDENRSIVLTISIANATAETTSMDIHPPSSKIHTIKDYCICLLYTSDAADD